MLLPLQVYKRSSLLKKTARPLRPHRQLRAARGRSCFVRDTLTKGLNQMLDERRLASQLQGEGFSHTYFWADGPNSSCFPVRLNLTERAAAVPSKASEFPGGQNSPRRGTGTVPMRPDSEEGKSPGRVSGSKGHLGPVSFWRRACAPTRCPTQPYGIPAR